MSRTPTLLLLILAASVAASAQQAPQFDLAVGFSTVEGSPSPAIAAAVTAWPSRLGIVVHGDYAERLDFLSSISRTSASVGVMAGLALPVEKGTVTLALGPSLSREYERPSTLEPARGWLFGATGRAQATVPLGRTVALALGVTGTASARGVRPSSTLGLSLLLAD